MDADHLLPEHAAAVPAATRPAGHPEAGSATERVRGRAHDSQLRLLNTADHPEWKLDEQTRAVGRRGIAQARAALRAARAEHLERSDASGSDGGSTTPAAHRSTAA
jgi:hypothetical protein